MNRASLKAPSMVLMLTGALALASLVAGPVSAQTKYNQWEGNQESGEIDDLVANLRELIDEAADARAADPLFLEDLNDLLAAYENPWGTRVLFDDFRDGNFNANPTWQVSAGQFKVDARGPNSGLKTSIGAAAGGQLNQLLGALLQPQQGQSQYASIFTPVKFANAFAVRFEFASRDRAGRFDFGPYQGASGSNAYRLAYMPGAATGLQLQRISSQGTQIIGQSSGPIAFEDGKPHVIDWTRDKQGRMVVTVDDKQVIAAQDAQLKKPFDGFLMINSGGTYWVRSVSVDAAN